MATATITSSKIEIRAVIRFLWLKNYKPVQIHGEVCKVYGDKTISQSKSGAICLKMAEWISMMITVLWTVFQHGNHH